MRQPGACLANCQACGGALLEVPLTSSATVSGTYLAGTWYSGLWHCNNSAASAPPLAWLCNKDGIGCQQPYRKSQSLGWTSAVTCCNIYREYHAPVVFTLLKYIDFARPIITQIVFHMKCNQIQFSYYMDGIFGSILSYSVYHVTTSSYLTPPSMRVI